MVKIIEEAGIKVEDTGSVDLASSAEDPEKLKEILASEVEILKIIKGELLEIKERYANPRRTEIVPAEGEFRMEDVIANEGCIITVSRQGFIKRTSADEYRSQRRGGKGLITIKCSDRNGPLMGIRDAHEGEELMVITRNGIMIRIALDSVSQQSRNTQGVKLINVAGEERLAGVERIIALNGDEEDAGEDHHQRDASAEDAGEDLPLTQRIEPEVVGVEDGDHRHGAQVVGHLFELLVGQVEGDLAVADTVHRRPRTRT